jgi:hypothetical protein
MNKKNKQNIICSIDEFEKRFYPKYFENKMAEEINEQRLGVNWAKDTFDKIRKELV